MAFRIKVADLVADALENNNAVRNLDTPREQAEFLAANHSVINGALVAGVEMEILKYTQAELQEDNTDRVILVS